jgi:hypothetical protein
MSLAMRGDAARPRASNLPFTWPAVAGCAAPTYRSASNATAILVKHGRLRPKRKSIPAHEIREVHGDHVILRVTYPEFGPLPDD